MGNSPIYWASKKQKQLLPPPSLKLNILSLLNALRRSFGSETFYRNYLISIIQLKLTLTQKNFKPITSKTHIEKDEINTKLKIDRY